LFLLLEENQEGIGILVDRWVVLVGNLSRKSSRPFSFLEWGEIPGEGSIGEKEGLNLKSFVPTIFSVPSCSIPMT